MFSKMRNPALAFLILLGATVFLVTNLAGISASSEKDSTDAGEAPQWQDRPEWAHHFSSQGVTGSFLLYDLNENRYYSYNDKHAMKRDIPASTFKVLNSLIALELGTVEDAEEVFPWDGVDRGIPVWNKDHSMREAIRNSTVWFYQELARRAGEKQMQHYVNLAGYGNQNIGGGIDRFWLDGKLRTSSQEQVDFLVELHQNEVPFSQRSIDIVKDILVMEQTDSYILRSKSGWARCFDFLPGCDETLFEPQLGWNVGYVERDGNAYFFALKVDIEEPQDGGARAAITQSILQEMAIID